MMGPDSNQLYQEIFEQAPDGMVTLDTSGVILLLNRRMLELTGYSDGGELRGRNIIQVLGGTDHARFMEFLNQVLSTGLGGVGQFGVQRKDGTVFIGEFSLCRGSRGAGSPGLVVVGLRDVSERARSEKALISALLMLNRLNSVNRHDIMNHLTVLLGYLELSHDLVTDATLKEFISKEEGAAEAIRRQVAFTKDYQDVGINVPLWVDLPVLLQETASVIDHPGVKVQVGISPGLKIFADPLIRKTISNIIENAVLHGKTATSITINSREQPDGLVIIFSDNGAGVPAGDKERIFARGVGIKRGYGLYLAREILAITGMKISETGEAENGARFEITVPRGGYRVG